MQIQIQASHFDEQGDWRASIEERVNFVLRRLRHQISQARISLSDINGPRGGVDKQCQLTLKKTGAGAVVITTNARTYANALDAALSRASQAIVRSLQRKRASVRGQARRDNAPTETVEGE